MTAPKVTVLDFGIGNIYSVCRAVEACGGEVILADTCPRVDDVERLILPGVGAFAKCLAAMRHYGAIDLARELALTERPLMGICVGMQALFDIGEEFGEHPGIGLIAGRVRKLPTSAAGNSLKLPHIGWAPLHEPDEGRWKGTVFEDVLPGESAYFVHSFHGDPEEPASMLATTSYGALTVTASVQVGNVSGVQFHPERSGPVGMKIISGFLRR